MKVIYAHNARGQSKLHHCMHRLAAAIGASAIKVDENFSGFIALCGPHNTTIFKFIHETRGAVVA